MDPRNIYPTCVLKVNLGCCQACVVAVKKLLSTLDGVFGFEIDSEKGLVTVFGRAHPQLLVEKIRQKKKKAEVVSYVEPTPKTKGSNNTNEGKKYGDLDSKPTNENKKKHCCTGDQKGFKKEDIFRQLEPDSHEMEAYVPPKPSLLDTCRDPYCKSHNPKPVIIRATDIAPKVMFPLPMNRPRFLPPPPRFLLPHPGPHYPSSYREEYPRSYRDYSEDHGYRLPHIEPIVYDKPLPQYDPWYHQRPPPQYDQWSYQRPPLPPHYGHHGAKHAYTGHY